MLVRKDHFSLSLSTRQSGTHPHRHRRQPRSLQLSTACFLDALPPAAAAAADVVLLLLLLRGGLAIRDRLDGGTREGEPHRLPPPRAANLLLLDASVLGEVSAVRFLEVPFDGGAGAAFGAGAAAVIAAAAAAAGAAEGTEGFSAAPAFPACSAEEVCSLLHFFPQLHVPVW